MLPGFPRQGALVRFYPPEMAYTARSAQHLAQGKGGLIYEVYNDSYAWVLFDTGVILVNTAYLEINDGADGERGPVRGPRLSANRKGRYRKE